MIRTLRAGLVAVFTLAALWTGVDGLQDKTSLRYSFKKGDKFPLKVIHNVSVKIDKVPELLQGILSDDPIDVKFSGTVDLEVVSVDDAGTAMIQGNWRLAKAKGHVMVNDIDFDFDNSKKQEPRPKKKEKEENEDLAIQALGDLQDQLDRMVRVPLKLSVDSSGLVSVIEAAGKVAQIEMALRSLNGVMGPLPKDKVGQGDTWTDDLKLSLPGMASQMDLKLKTENKIDSIGKVDGEDSAVIKSKFAMKTTAAEKPEAAAGVEPKIKTEGGGEGTTVFSIAAGRSSKANSALRIKIHAVIPNPGGGEELKMEAVLKVDTQLDLK